MRIGLFTDTYHPIISGVTISLKILKVELEKRGHEVFVFTYEHPMQKEDSTVIRFKGHKLPIKRMHEYRVSKVTSKLVNVVLTYNLDLIHCHTEFTMGRLGRRASIKGNIPIVHTYHTMYEDYCHHISKTFVVPLRFISKKYSKRFANSVDQVIFPTIKVKRTFEQYGFNKNCEIIPTGIYLDKFRRINFNDVDIAKLKKSLGYSEDDFIWLFIGRLSKEKNIADLIKEFSKLNLPKSNKLLIVGDGPDRPIFESLAKKLNIADRIHFTGMIDPLDVPMFYQISDLFINFSDTETQGLTFIEALASGLPVLAKYDDNLEGVIIDNFNGLTFNENQDFKKAYYDLVVNKVKFNEITNNASKAIEKFSAQAFAIHIEDVYNRLIKKG